MYRKIVDHYISGKKLKNIYIYKLKKKLLEVFLTGYKIIALVYGYTIEVIYVLVDFSIFIIITAQVFSCTIQFIRYSQGHLYSQITIIC